MTQLVSVERSVRYLIITFVLAAVSGCWIQTNTAMIEPVRARRPFCKAGVTLFPESAAVGKPFARVAWLQPRHYPDWIPSDERVQGALRARAAQLGANGLIVPETPYPESLTPGGKLYYALAIFVPEDSAHAVNACRRDK